jgi:hypothetical protein
MIGFLLANRFPLLLWWGPQYVSIYNDAYRPILGAKHPTAMGQPFREVWPEIEHILSPLIDTPFNGGPATWMDDILLEVNRNGYSEETHFTIAYSPVPDDTAPRGIGGVLATVHEITEKVVGERRIQALRDLRARAAESKSAEEACCLTTPQYGGCHSHQIQCSATAHRFSGGWRQSAPAPRRSLSQLSRTRRCADFGGHNERSGVRTGVQTGASAGGNRSRQDNFLLEYQS